MNTVTRAFEAQVEDVVEGERSVIAKISTDKVDRYRTSFIPDGADLKAYRTNPVVLWEHGNDPARGTMPIGKNKWIDIKGRSLVAKTIFRNDPYSDMIFRAYQDGGLRGWSIRALNPEHSPPTKDEIRARPELELCDTVFRKWELGEYSATALPGNPDTLTILAERGIWMPAEVQLAAPSLASDQVNSVIHTAPYIDEEAGDWVVRNADGSQVARFPDQPTAQECLSLMAGGPSWDRTAIGILGEVQAVRLAMKQDVEEYIALYRHGRV